MRSLRVFLSCVSLALSLFVFAFSGSLLSRQVMDRLSSSASTASSIDDYSEQNMWNLLLELLFFMHVNGIVDSYLVDLDLAKIALFVILLLIYSVTRRKCSSLHVDTLDTTVHGISIWCGAPLPSAWK